MDEQYLLREHLGSVHTIADGVGEVASRQRFAPYGEQLEPEEPETDYGFTGHEHDRDLGLIYMRGRMYDPKLGRFLSADLVCCLDMRGGRTTDTRPGSDDPETKRKLKRTPGKRRDGSERWRGFSLSGN